MLTCVVLCSGGRFSPCTIIFSVNGLACIWFLHIRALSYHGQGLDTCTNYTAVQELRNMDMKVAAHRVSQLMSCSMLQIAW